MERAEVGVVDLGKQLGMADGELAARMARPGSLRVNELILLAVALGHEVHELLPAADCLPGKGCAACSGGN
ncbi:hypothetical protein D7D52_25235 [Nocardia yunnanensis]|uniref:XRE family transcriptional regulator n=1 Tax=Nocardia yunnanensis TaxID=2382165 RepID=A0A386ZGN3_9NOCA|nr:hypothetical protein D7D52_25235 [Nocardia yunnanensis]